MANHARRVVQANGVDHIVTVIQGAVEDVVLPEEDWDGMGVGLVHEEGDVECNADGGRKNQRVVDIILSGEAVLFPKCLCTVRDYGILWMSPTNLIIAVFCSWSEWMGYFLLRESMLDSLVRARDTFLKPKTGLMMPSHATMLLAPIADEEERRALHTDYAAAMEDWKEFAETTQTMYGVDMSVLEKDFDREQKEYYVLSSRWAELRTECLLAEPCVVKEYDMHTCTVEDARGVGLSIGEDEGNGVPFDFDVVGRSSAENAHDGAVGPISGFAGWFTVDFKSRTDEIGRGIAPEVSNPSHLSTGPVVGCKLRQLFHCLY